jgi:predicted outer membrane repeat protein
MVAHSSFAATIHVPSEAATIQAGIDAASPGDTVLVATGTYVGPGNRDIDFGGTDLVLRSESGAQATIIDCEGSGRGFVFHTAETPSSVVEGFTIRNADAGLELGGGFYVLMASPTIRACVFTNCQANSGGGVYVEQSSIQFENCEFNSNNAANWGGGVLGLDASLTLTDCLFEENAAARGGGMHLRDGSLAMLETCTFSTNEGANAAGGIYCGSSELSVTGCSFEGNSSAEGGGVRCESGATAIVDGCLFSMNTALNHGGAIFCQEQCVTRIAETVFEGNMTTSNQHPTNGGGAVCCDHVVSNTIVDCEFSDNHVLGDDGRGGALLLKFIAAEQDTIRGCIFTGNTAVVSGGASHLQAAYMSVVDCYFADNVAFDPVGAYGGAIRGSHIELVGCDFERNHAGNRGGGAYLSGASRVRECSFAENAARDGGGIYQWTGTATATISSTKLSRNSSGRGGGIYVSVSSGGTTDLADCVVEENSAAEGGGGIYVRWYEGEINIGGCTLVGNTASVCSGLWIEDGPVEVTNSIVAFGIAGDGIHCGGSGIALLSCTDVYGNEGGDWVGCIADQFGINGNLSADPLFCNPLASDYTLAETSPCAPEHSPAGCGLIGALPVGCDEPIAVAEQAPPAPVLCLRVSPNPIRGQGMIEWASDAALPCVLKLWNAQGRLVVSREVGASTAGARRLRWAEVLGGHDVASGVYYLEMRNLEGARAVARIVVIE